MAVNEIYQYSVMSALMAGVATTGIPLPTLLKQGDHGIGTFTYMQSELILIDGIAWQVNGDGSIVALDRTDVAIELPFAMVTRFSPTLQMRVSVSGKASFAAMLAHLLPDAGNLFVAVRLQGQFRSVVVRTSLGQSFPGQALPDAEKNQAVFALEGAGVVVGFRSPRFIRGVGVAGLHFHFASHVGGHGGGHVLEMEGDDVELQAAVVTKVHLELPAEDTEYNTAVLN